MYRSTVLRCSPRTVATAVVSAVVALVALLLPAVTRSASADTVTSQPKCTSFTRQVALSAASTKQYDVKGQLCLPASGPVKAAQVLISGATYGQIYWNFPVDPARYSYVDALAKQGYATLNFDRVGIGASSHPAGVQVTTQAGAYEVHQLVGDLRNGSFGQKFATVETVAHSYGSVIAISEAASFHDVDGMVISGLLHHLDTGLSKLEASLYPARLDPDPEFTNLGPAYLTTLPNTRGDLFYYQPNADPAVIAKDEATKETFTVGEQSTFPGELLRSVEVRTPTLVIVGDEDKFFCTEQKCSAPVTGGLALEKPFWASGCLTTQAVPNAGHDLVLQRNSQVFDSRVAQWSATNVADPATAAAADQRCLTSPPATHTG